MTDSSTPTRRRLLLGLGVAATASIAGCSTTSDDDDSGTDTPTPNDPDGTASLRVAHLSPNAPNVDVYVDGTAVLEDVPFGAVSTYLDVPAGSRLVRISPAGDVDTVVFEGDVPVAADGVYTVAAIGEVGETVQQSFEPLVLEDDNSDPDAETARLRVVHASPDAPAVDVTVDGGDDALFDGVEYGQSGYVTVPAGEYTVEIRGDTETNDGDVVASFDLALGAGGVYTAFAGGYLASDDDDRAFDLFVV
ncbi:MAG TPA: DUF4397 domain-containing protein, partial [Natrialbaceae archaeon]|nr:DUF4397 domain-containing protein [Natrialbaceae archaeon]